MPFRVGILDLTAAIIVLVVIALPQRSPNVADAYDANDDKLRAIALYQARLAADRGDAEAADKLAKLLTETGQTDWAVQVASEAAKHTDDLSWRALLAVSSAHAERIEVIEAHRFAKLALEACIRAGDACPSFQKTRMSVYYDQLDAGMKSGIDPRLNPAGYQRAVLGALRVIRFRGPTPDDQPDTEDEDTEDEPDPKPHNPSGEPDDDPGANP